MKAQRPHLVPKQSLVRPQETQKPEKELLVVGQHAVWDYFEADKVAMKYRSSQVFNSKTMRCCHECE